MLKDETTAMLTVHGTPHEGSVISGRYHTVCTHCSCSPTSGSCPVPPRRTDTVTVKARPYSITECRVPELIPVLGSQPAGDVSHRPGDRLPLLSARPAVTPATGKRAATNFAAW